MQIFGTTTSPFVRRVRVVASELGLPHTLVDTRVAENVPVFRGLSPIWKVPVLVRDGEAPLFDSHAIVASLLRREGPGPFRMPSDRDRENNFVNVVDGALDSLINVFALSIDGIQPEASPYLRKQLGRAGASIDWIASRLRGPWLTEDERLGPAELVLHTALDWMVFRERWPVDDDPRLRAFRAFHGERPSFAATFPHP